MRISWNDLGPPKAPGRIIVKGLGTVDIKQDDIDRAGKYGESVSFELHDATTVGDEMHNYLLGMMVP